MQTPASVLVDLLAADPARPRLTFYEDSPGPTHGERIELSAKVFANWVAKAANALQDEFDAGPGSIVALVTPPSHWRTLYWAVAAWSVGATITLDASAPHDVLITDDSEADSDADLVVVTLAALARSHPGSLPSGAMDEARELSTYGDRFAPSSEPAPDDDALVDGGEHTAYDRLVPEQDWPRGARVHVTGGSAQVLRGVLAAWAIDGSVVLVRDPAPELMADRLSSEGVTLDLGGAARR